MAHRRELAILLLAAAPALAQGSRGKAEMKAGSGSITIDYGRPSAPTDRVGEQQVGEVWRMGKDAATVIKTPVDLMFGATHVAAGSYSLFLARPASDRYELVFNSQTGQWGTNHDPSKDVVRVPLRREAPPNLVETFTIELKGAAKGGTFVMSWGKTRLSADFTTK
jgi:hypothetical protein